MLKLVLVLITCIPIFTYRSAVLTVLCFEGIVLIVLIVRHAIPTKFRFSIIKGMKYSIHDIAYCAFMFIIYFFGVHDMSSTDVQILTAFNMLILCTDTQWDICGQSIDVSVSTYICDGVFEKNRKKIYRNNIMFSFIMMLSSFLLFVIMIPIHGDVNVEYVLVFMLIELSTMVPYGAIDTMSTYIGIMYPNAWIGVLTIWKYSVRILCQLFVPSMYAISIALPVAVIADLPFRILLYRKARRKAMVSNE